MNFVPGKLYHVYNQGNDRQPIFFSRENYLYFLRKMRKELTPLSDILAYCLMPNHFHWLLYVSETEGKESEASRPTALSGPTGKHPHPLVTKIAVLQSSYTQTINKQENRSGSLFRQKAKAIKIDSPDYALVCIHYIHQNPLKAGLVYKLDQWEYSSFKEYIHYQDNPLINKERAFQMIDLDRDRFLKDSYGALNPDFVERIVK